MQYPTQKSVFSLWPALLGLLLCTAVSSLAWAEVDDEDENLPPVHLPVYTDLQAVAAEARQRQLPILIMFSQNGCGYCVIVEEEFLKPMLRSGDYTDRVMMGMVKFDGVSRVRDFDGEMISVGDLAVRYGAPVTPTVIFVDPEGKELSAKVIGMTTVHFYGGDLDIGINQSLQKMRPTHTAMRPSL